MTLGGKISIGVVWKLSLAGAAAAFLLLVTRPQLQRLGHLAQTVRAEQVEAVSGPNSPAAVLALRQEVEALSAAALRFDERIPQKEMLGEFLEAVGRFVQAHGLQAEAVQPGQPIRAEQLAALPVALKLHGTFPALYKLIQDIERLPRLTQVERFKAETDPTRPGQVAAELDLRILFQVSPAGGGG